MAPHEAMRDLRRALTNRGVICEDVRDLPGCYSTLLLSGGFTVSVGPEFFRWFSRTAKEWAWHPVTDPDGAAHLLATRVGRTASGTRVHRARASCAFATSHLLTRGPKDDENF